MCGFEETIVFTLNTQQNIRRQISSHFARHLPGPVEHKERVESKPYLLAFPGCPSSFPEESLTSPRATKDHFLVGSETSAKPIPKEILPKCLEEALLLQVATLKVNIHLQK